MIIYTFFFSFSHPHPIKSVVLNSILFSFLRELSWTKELFQACGREMPTGQLFSLQDLILQKMEQLRFYGLSAFKIIWARNKTENHLPFLPFMSEIQQRDKLYKQKPSICFEKDRTFKTIISLLYVIKEMWHLSRTPVSILMAVTLL